MLINIYQERGRIFDTQLKAMKFINFTYFLLSSYLIFKDNICRLTAASFILQFFFFLWLCWKDCGVV